MAKCLVLGANGFIGSHLVDSLVSQNHDVVAFDRSSDTVRYNQSDKITPLAGDFLNREDLRQAVQGVDYVFHFISTTTPATAENDPLIDVETNLKMSIILFDECVRANVKRVIFASTGGAIYGSSDGLPSKEDDPTLPVSPYAIGKLSIENYLRYFNKKYGLSTVTYRISNPYGDRQPTHAKQGVIPIFLEHIAQGEPITVLGDGSMVRDYIYVKDVTDMIAMSFESAKQTLYNIGSGRGVTVNELVEKIKTITQKSVVVEHKPTPPTFVEKITLNIDRFRSEFKDVSHISLDDGISKTWEYVQSQVGETR